MSIYRDIQNEASRLDDFSNYDYSILDKLLAEAEKVGSAWSGSWLGYHSRVYYDGLKTPPPGAHFSTEWGLYSEYGSLGMCSIGDWKEYNFSDVVDYIKAKAGEPDLTEPAKISRKAEETIDNVKNDILSLIHAQSLLENDKFLQKLVSDLENVAVPSQSNFVKSCLPKGRISTRDQRVEHKIIVPPHKHVECTVYGIKAAFVSAEKLQKISLRISNYLHSLENKMERNARIGSNVFIGHGRSQDWRDLKDFVGERLNLPWDEFNRVPVAGLTNITRLSQMLDQACIAFLVMTAEDEQADGNHHARMNVLHEVGLFQGRLGFEKAIVLLEEGCEEFSNIQGLGQIRYPKGKISAVFEDIRRVLERESII